MALRCALIYIYIFFWGGGGVMVIRSWMLIRGNTVRTKYPLITQSLSSSVRFAVDSMCYNDRIWLMDRAHTNTKSSMQ